MFLEKCIYISKHVNKHLHTHILAFQPTHCCNKHCVAAANRLKIQIVHGWEIDIMGFGKNTKNRKNQFVCVCAHYVCANSHITSALFEPLKCQQKEEGRALQTKRFAFHATIEFKACMRFFLTQ